MSNLVVGALHVCDATHMSLDRIAKSTFISTFKDVNLNTAERDFNLNDTLDTN